MNSMTIREAELSKIPIIVRRYDSYLDSVFDGKNGYVCDTDDQMCDRMLELANDDEKRKKFGERSLEITKNFSIENHIKRTLFVYNEVIKAYPEKIDDVEVMKRMNEEIK